MELKKESNVRIKMSNIARYVLLFFVFVVLVGTVFWGVQWFSWSLGGLLIHNNSFFTSSLQPPIDSAIASGPILPAINKNLLPLRQWQIEDLTIPAPSAISVQIGTSPDKILFKKNEEKKLPVASLTKLMTALVVLDNYNLDQKIVIDQEAMAQEGDQGGLKLGETFSVKDLLYIALMESSNRAAYALSELIGTDNFIILMNDKAVKMGLANTHFQDATGLDSASYSTAKDLATLSEYLFKNYPLFKKIINLKEYDLYLPDGTLHHTLINTNSLLGQNNIIGGKTGYTNEALGCFMAVQNGIGNGNYIINVVLGSQDRFTEMQNIINWVNSAYQWQ